MNDSIGESDREIVIFKRQEEGGAVRKWKMTVSKEIYDNLLDCYGSDSNPDSA